MAFCVDSSKPLKFGMNTFTSEHLPLSLMLMLSVPSQAGAMMMEVSYGFEALSQNDPFIDTADKAFEAVAAVGISGAFLVDAMPFLKHVPSWFPGAGFKQKAKQWKRHADDTVNAPLEALKVNIVRCIDNGVGGTMMLISIWIRLKVWQNHRLHCGAFKIWTRTSTLLFKRV